MRQPRTTEEEQLRQLKLISGQLNPLGVFFRVGFWLAVLLFTIGLLSRLCTPGRLFPN
jgi:hypothetical protein